jgi:Fic family protein
MSAYIHELPGWPKFHWDYGRLAERLATVRHQQGHLLGRMESLGFHLQREAELQTLTADVVKSSEIEGERLDEAQVRSSLARRLGIDIGGLKPVQRHVEGVVEMTLDATEHFDQPLTAGRLCGWHAALFPTGRSGLTQITVGAWRTDSRGPMQVVSGPIGREQVHFRAPAADRLDGEMTAFLNGFNSETTMDAVLKAALAHLWFVSIHPFDDGNGRIARAITDLALARSENSPQRFYSMSLQIQQERGDYYDRLEQAQKGTLDITLWMDWFLGCLERAIQGANTQLATVLAKARFWERLTSVAINDRQRLILNRLLDGFEGKVTSSKWATLAKCSPDTALRDINELVIRGILRRDPGGGRSTSYSLVDDQGPQFGQGTVSSG